MKEIASKENYSNEEKIGKKTTHFLLAAATAITTLFVVGIEYIFCGNNNTPKGWSWKTMACIRFYLYTQTAFAAGIADFLRFACFKWNSFFLSLHSFTPFACLGDSFQWYFCYCKNGILLWNVCCGFQAIGFGDGHMLNIIHIWFIENGTCTEHM